MRFEDSELDALADRLAERLATRLAARLQAPPVEAVKTHWTEREVAESVGIAPLTLRNWRLAGSVEAATTKRPIVYTSKQLEQVAKFMAARG